MIKKQTDLALSGLTKLYGSTRAVDGVTMRIAAGELVALLGPSGCGKTTTLRMIAGLVEPTDGDVLVGGHRITRIPVHRRNIGMLFQSYALFPHLTIAENVAFGLQMRGMRRSVIGEKVDNALALVQLSAQRDRRPAALSGGQQQRVALARAIVIEPTLLLLDEPLGALDKNLRESMQMELRLIQKRLGITAVLVTHDQEEAMTMADRIVIMRGGKLEQIGTPTEVYSRPTSKFVAGFIGASNFLKTSTIASHGTEHEATLAGGGRIRVSGPIPAQGDILVAVRPEAIDVAPAGASADISGNGTFARIEQTIFRGQVMHIHMRLDDGEPLLAYVPNRDGGFSQQGLNQGTRVAATWSPESNIVVANA